jgi:hypothetical protein
MPEEQPVGCGSNEWATDCATAVSRRGGRIADLASGLLGDELLGEQHDREDGEGEPSYAFRGFPQFFAQPVT